MPHAVDGQSDEMSSAPLTNGDRPSSLFISHLTNYPVVSDGINTFKANHYGAKSLDLVHILYEKIVLPVAPYLRTPYSIVYPYLSKADGLADNGLTKVDERFPVVKEETQNIKSNAYETARYPIVLAAEGRKYVFDTYDDEYKRVGGQGIFKTVQAGLSTQLRIAFDAISYIQKGGNKAAKKVNQSVQ